MFGSVKSMKVRSMDEAICFGQALRYRKTTYMFRTMFYDKHILVLFLKIKTDVLCGLTGRVKCCKKLLD